ncbi:hypothetical protein PCANC_04174 [Puccinia coronata f. sp. avenae]|uniref:Integrase catalytic domain-containing protein n=1 Tax=Puccinia coronata f. sp. avenae TaxID=200324 RepID=A0A2N5W7A6_9BASI|nr:hypothetical protein PCANC_04174 [Puccinia coronata f. sp. avenae]
MKKFIWGLQKYVGTLTPLTSTKLDKQDFRWGQAEEDAFNNIKQLMTSLPCLKNVDYNSDDPLWLFTDASGSGLGAALFQGKDWKLALPIAYESHLMTPAKHNSVANALSRKDTLDNLTVTADNVACVAALSKFKSVISKTLKAQIVLGYVVDPFCLSLKPSLPLREDCKIADDLIIIDSQLLIPDTGDLQQNLISEAHVCLGHLGYLKTITKLRWDFFWPKMARDVHSFVSLCEICQKTKAPTTSPTGKMGTPEFPRLPLTHIAIDFVGPLTTSGHYDMLLSVTCQLSGFTRIIPVVQKDTAEKTASRFFAGWIALFGAPLSIISGRDKKWSAKFWNSLMSRLSTRFHQSSAFHPKADGRSERTNKTIGQILRMFTLKKQSKWLESLPAVEFAINSAINVSTGILPLNLILGKQPTLFETSSSLDNSDHPALSKWLAVCEKAWATACDQLCTSRLKQAIQHNKNVTDCSPPQPGMLALLNLADWRGSHQPGSDKLKERFEGPYEVLRVFNYGQNVELDLPAGNQCHPTFHVSKIKRFVTREGPDQATQGDLLQK